MSVARQLIFSMSLDPELSVSGFYSFPQLADGNGSGSMFTCAYIPPQKSGTISMRPNVVFLGTQNTSLMLQALNENKTLDGDTEISANIISNAIIPTLEKEEPMEMVRFISLEMGNINALPNGVVIKYLVDKENPHINGYLWNDTYYESGSNRVFFPDAVGRWLHIKVIDETQVISRDMWTSFTLSYYRLGTRPQEGASS